MKRGRGALIAALFGLAIALGAAAVRGGFAAPEPAEGFAAWSDAFFIAAVFVGGSGLLAFAASDGLFDVIRYGVGKVLRVVLPKEKRDLYPKTFYDYRLLKQGRGPAGTSAMLVGAACLALGGLFLALSMHSGPV